MAAVVRERVRRLERALHGVARLPEHGVQESVAGDQRTYGLQRAHLVAESCANHANGYKKYEPGYTGQRFPTIVLCGGVQVI